MCRVVIQHAENVTVPEWVFDRKSFLRWAESEEFPEGGRIDYLAGEIWIDMSQEQIYSHNQVKAEFFYVLTGLAKASRLGRFYPDGLRLEHPEADLAAVPDGMYISKERLQTLRIRQVEGAEGGFVRMEGSPDIALEIVSKSSVNKDTVRLKGIYWTAGVREYWFVDARTEPLTFTIWKHSAKGYVAVRGRGGWLKSDVLGKAFRLTAGTDELGDPEYSLDVR
jgi:Uma2 family endonuclease